MTFEDLMNNYQAYLLVFARVFGIFAFNPIFSRRNMPSIVKIGATVALTLVIAMSAINNVHVEYDSLPLLAVAFFKEGIIGVILGFITQLFLSTLLVGGELMDMQSGLGMASIYDPASGVQMPLFGSVMTYMFLMYFFITDCHLSYIKIFAISYDFVPVGWKNFNPDVAVVLVNYFGTVLALALKLAVPLVLAQLLLEFCAGILMKAVPQIQVMQVNIQIKLLFGLFLLFILAAPLSDAIDKYMQILTDNLTGILPSLIKI